MNKIRIEVTQEDIDFALQQNKGNCAVARAIRRAGWREYSTGLGKPGLTAPKVDADKIVFTDKEYEQRLTFETPPKVAKFVDLFDRDKGTVRPFVFTLDYDRATQVKPEKHHNPSLPSAVNKAKKRREYYEAEVARAKKEGRSTVYRPLR